MSQDKTVITKTEEGFKFLGANCRRVITTKIGYFSKGSRNNNPAKYRLRMRITAPIRELMDKLVINKFAKKRTGSGLTYPTARKDLINFTHMEILNYYNQRIRGILNFYSFAANFNELRKLLSILQLSCALTLVLKTKVRTMKRVFNKYGKYLQDPETERKLELPSNLKVKHHYNGLKPNSSEQRNIIDKSMEQSMFQKLTKSILEQSCVVCGSNHKIQMHHVRKVKDVRNKIRTGESTYVQ